MKKFNLFEQIADNFDSHARQHIPDYNLVIQKTIDICDSNLIKQSSILDIGCATGAIVRGLSNLGFKNLYAVDSSQQMLDQCPKNIATYYLSNQFPIIDIKFDAIICNWTLHFIKNKISYMKKIYDALKTGGFLILTEKTENAGLALEKYHNFKRSQGVTEEEIINKANLLKNTMFINSVDWYLKKLHMLGFKKISIFHATWCFTSLIAIK